MKKYIIIMLALILALPLCVAAADDDDEWYPLQIGSISFRIGAFFPRGESDLWDENTTDLTFEVSDFNNFNFGVEFNWFMSRYFTLGFAVDHYSKTVSTEYRDYVGNDGYPIAQDISLDITPVTATIKFTPLGNGSPGYRGERGSPIVPWIGAGVGLYSFTYEETGEYIDFSDFSVFNADFITPEGVGFGVHVAGGLVIPITLEWDVFGEVRYAIAKGDLSDDFLGFEPLDLSGMSVHFGASYRF